LGFPAAGAGAARTLGGLPVRRGPWRWLIFVYRHFPEENRVVVVTIQDARSSSAVNSQ
jgi:hypothetical protein